MALIAALFSERAAAERALAALIAQGLTTHQARIVARRTGHTSELAPFRDAPEIEGSLRGLSLPEEDRLVFQDGIGRGAALIAAPVERANFSKAVEIVEAFDPMDVDRCTAEWQREQVRRPSGPGMTAPASGPLGADLTGGAAYGRTGTAALPGMGQLRDDGSTLGTADLRTQEMSKHDQGSSTTPTGGRGEERAGAPGIREAAQGPGSGAARQEAEIAAKMTRPEQTPQADADSALHRAPMGGTGRVRSYVRAL
ncbi:MAG TPA: hypothetical protein VM434_07115 [Beijerinckiaceae bacterium]|nr:hypothetical protein [Beijerinckiaceae bacterium]